MLGISLEEITRILGTSCIVIITSVILHGCTGAKPGSDKLRPDPSGSDAGKDSSTADAKTPSQEDGSKPDIGGDTGTKNPDGGEDTGTTQPIPDADTDGSPSLPEGVTPPMGVDISPAGGIVRSEGFKAQLMIGVPQPVGRVESEDYIVNVAPNATVPNPSK